MEVSMNLLNLDKQKALKLYIACISEFGIVIWMSIVDMRIFVFFCKSLSINLLCYDILSLRDQFYDIQLFFSEYIPIILKLVLQMKNFLYVKIVWINIAKIVINNQKFS